MSIKGFFATAGIIAASAGISYPAAQSVGSLTEHTLLEAATMGNQDRAGNDDLTDYQRGFAKGAASTFGNMAGMGSFFFLCYAGSAAIKRKDKQPALKA